MVKLSKQIIERSKRKRRKRGSEERKEGTETGKGGRKEGKMENFVSTLVSHVQKPKEKKVYYIKIV